MVTPSPRGNGALSRFHPVNRRGSTRQSYWRRSLFVLPCLLALAFGFSYVNVLLHSSLSTIEATSHYQYVPFAKDATGVGLVQKHYVTRLWLDLIVELQYPSTSNTTVVTKQSLPKQVRKDPLDPIQTEMRVVYPARWNLSDYVLFRNDSRELPIHKVYEIMHAQWPPKPPRFPGVEDHFVSVEEGGKLVQGTWPDRITNMTLLTILKNGHTHLMNSMGDLRQRLEGCHSDLMKSNDDKRIAKTRILERHHRLRPQPQNGPWQDVLPNNNIDRRQSNTWGRAQVPQPHENLLVHAESTDHEQSADKKPPKVLNVTTKEVLQYAQTTQEAQNALQPGHVVFAVLRDPIHRFISATCQEFAMKKGVPKRYNRDEVRKIENDGLALINMTIDHILQGTNKGLFQFLFHQSPQITQILTALQGVDVGITFLSYETAFAGVIEELGGRSFVRQRDRTSDEAYAAYPSTKSVCSLKASNLTEIQRMQICDIYQADVKLMQFVGMEVPRCPGYDQADYERQRASESQENE